MALIYPKRVWESDKVVIRGFMKWLTGLRSSSFPCLPCKESDTLIVDPSKAPLTLKLDFWESNQKSIKNYSDDVTCAQLE